MSAHRTVPRLEMRGISKRFPGVRALDSVQLQAWGGEVLALMGENGAGKSTLMKILSGAYHADPGGQILIDAAPVHITATVQTNNVQAGEIACQFMAQAIHDKGNVVIENGPQVSAVIDRVKGCDAVLAKYPGIRILSSDQDGKGSREGGLNAMQGYLTRFPDIQGVFAINGPQAIGSDLAAKQLNRGGITIVSVDGAPDIVAALKGNTEVQASASQDPYAMGKLATQVGYDIMNGKKPADPMILMPSKLVTRANVDQYLGWSHH